MHSFQTVRLRRLAAAIIFATGCLIASSACEPLGLGLPSTLDLERGAADGLNAAKSFEVTGSYVISSVPWSVDLELTRPEAEHIFVNQGTTQLEAVVLDARAYFRSRTFLSQHLGTASAARSLIDAAGTAWWLGTPSSLPDVADFTDGTRLRADFLGPSATQRLDHISIDGVDTAAFIGPRAAVYIAESAPHHLVRLRITRGAIVDGITGGDMHYSHFGQDFGIAAPQDVIDFSNLSTLPPEYTVASVDTSGCGTPCVVSAVVKNLGGKDGGQGPSTVMFTMSDSASGKALGNCTAQVSPDVAYNATADLSCTIDISAVNFNAAIVTATPFNPGHS